jgi:hypothetical protein
MTNKTTIFLVVAILFGAKGFLVLNAESLVFFTFVVFVAGMSTHFRESVLDYFAARGQQIEKEFYSARASVQSYFTAYSAYLRFELALLSALTVGVGFCQQASWASVARAQYDFKQQLRNQVMEKFKRVAVFESLGVLQLQSSMVGSVPSALTTSFGQNALWEKENGLSDSIEDLGSVGA